MKTKTTIYLITLTVVLSTMSCSIEKRHYRNGFSVNWNTKQTGTSKSTHQQTAAIVDRDTIVADIVAPTQVVENKKEIIIKDSCDIIEMKNGNTVRAKVLEINTETVKYKNCGDNDGPDRIVEKDKIESITYSNGKKEDAREFRVNKKEVKEGAKNQPGAEAIISDIKTTDARRNAKTSIILGALAVVLLLAGAGLIYAASVSGDIAVVIFGIIFGFVLGIAAIVLGVIAIVTGSKVLNKANKDPEYARWKKAATVGLALGAAVLFLLFGGIIVGLFSGG
jgi:hypothetical protein